MKDLCSECGEYKQVFKNQITKQILCRRCRRNDKTTHEICSKCGEKKYVHSRTVKGEPVCQVCYKDDPSKHKKCFECGKTKAVALRLREGVVICHNCYPKFHIEPCSICKIISYVHTRDGNKNPICVNCHNRDPLTHEKCADCGRVRQVHSLNKSGQPICGTCYKVNRRNRSFFHLIIAWFKSRLKK